MNLYYTLNLECYEHRALPVITEIDEFFRHQTIRFRAHVVLDDPIWTERACNTLTVPGRSGLEIALHQAGPQ